MDPFVTALTWRWTISIIGDAFYYPFIVSCPFLTAQSVQSEDFFVAILVKSCQVNNSNSNDERYVFFLRQSTSIFWVLFQCLVATNILAINNLEE